MNQERKIALGMLRDRMQERIGRFPVKALPEEMQEIVLSVALDSGLMVDYLACGMLVAAAAAVGHAVTVQIKDGWETNPVLFVLLVGPKGVGKTPALAWALRPLRVRDKERYEAFVVKMQEYEKQLKAAQKSSAGDAEAEMPEKPTLEVIIVNDATQEKLMRILGENPRGLLLVNDELTAFLSRATRYKGSTLVDDLLSAYSQEQIKVSRVSRDIPIVIDSPCLSFISGTQPRRVHELLEHEASGFLDRLAFVYQQRRVLGEEWPDDNTHHDTIRCTQWQQVVNGLLNIPFRIDPETHHAVSQVWPLTADARKRLFEWRNSQVAHVNASRTSKEEDLRFFKEMTLAARLALVLQILRVQWGEAKEGEVDLAALDSAMLLCEYFRESYRMLTMSWHTMSCRRFTKRCMTPFPTALPDRTPSLSERISG